MSKMDALRAMREARYAETTARAAKAAAAKPSAAKPAVAPAAKPAAAKPATKPAASPDPESTPGTEELCGHRNMGGRTCTREKAHAAKSHRYS